MADRDAIAYYRTSSAANVGADKDSLERQRSAVESYAKRAGLQVVAEFYDAAVSGADPIDTRAGFAAALERIAGNGVRKIIVETASRFARDLIVQEVGYRMLCERGIELIAADSPEGFADDTPTARLIRQILGAVSEFEKAALVAKLRGARDRKSREVGRRIEGRRPVPADAVVLARRLNRKSKSGGRPSLRTISARLAEAGHLAPSGAPYGTESVKRMIAR
ncbi:recombinase family protein [Bosea sp. (in: a-proteobacteria)]|uniref:recombinase family protein n=1 Tax=Bosea sp. (in: a-proteobacteria) TaxID=1871050 RepID=UPI0026128BC9|nr:recombinase family protein [Bosea sp. (in: a-proteobacteria)]MCO5089878.1 recombinase family protein [Bosea sp. (in: a-proteobacteria)]